VIRASALPPVALSPSRLRLAAATGSIVNAVRPIVGCCPNSIRAGLSPASRIGGALGQFPQSERIGPLGLAELLFSLSQPPQALFSASMSVKEDQISEMSDADRVRIGRILTDAAAAVGWNVTWGQAYLDVWVTEQRMRAERQATERLTAATWALVIATCVLALTIIALLVVIAPYLKLASVMSPVFGLR
jgi:hypothetical protein